MRGKTCEGTVPHFYASTRFRDGALHAFRWILAYSEADRGCVPGRVQAGLNIRTRGEHAEGFTDPLTCEIRERLRSISAIGATFEKTIIFFQANGKQAKLGQP